ncbi:Conserved TM helix [Haloechinothrix alba]|uniref:Conserved TM helix n=2 Tax=Haloechinothrix alba TaxID=664784 RepID=A0A238WHF4_9PSEU|nr:Conserved TM helix [Haloechinothrix alba]
MDQLRDGLGDAWSVVTTFVPKLVFFLIILLIGWLIAKAVAKALTLVLGKLGFSSLVEKTGLSGTLSQANIDAASLIAKLAYFFILLIALQLAFGVFGPTNPVSELLNDVIAFLPRVLVAIVLVIVAAAIAKMVRDLVNSALAGRPAGWLLGMVAYWFIIALGIIAALNQVQIATTVTTPVLIAVLATVGGVIVVGFGGGLIKPAQERWAAWLDNMQSNLSSGGQAQAGQRSGAQSGQEQSGQEPPTPPQGTTPR